jgi:hypothetical protein
MCVISWRARALPNVRLLGSTKGCTKVPNSDPTSMEETYWAASSDATPMGEKGATALRQILISGQLDLKSQIISCQTVASYYCERFLELLAPKLKAEGLCTCTCVYIWRERSGGGMLTVGHLQPFSHPLIRSEQLSAFSQLRVN